MKNSKKWILQIWAFGLGLICFPPLGLSRVPPEKLCKIMKDYSAGTFTPKKLCEQYDGRFCELADNMMQAVCRAHGGSFCSTVENWSEALCRALNQQDCVLLQDETAGFCLAFGNTVEQCRNLSHAEKKKWERKFKSICGIAN